MRRVSIDPRTDRRREIDPRGRQRETNSTTWLRDPQILGGPLSRKKVEGGVTVTNVQNAWGHEPKNAVRHSQWI